MLPILLHGDAAFAGQGVVAECFGLSGLKGHRTGGTIHIVVNNQIGFTTAPQYSRSSPYPTDIALMVEAPIFHVNGDDPEAVVHAARVATEFRQQFNKDVVIDMFCYRRFGHNEGDEPMFTQPLMYKAIKGHKTTLQIYTERLVADGLIPEGEIEDMKAAFQAHLNAEFEAGKDYRPNKADWLDGRWSGLGRREGRYQRGKTAVELAKLKKVGEALTRLPDNFEAHRTVQRMLEAKRQMIETGDGIDWATAEALAFGTLLCRRLPGAPLRPGLDPRHLQPAPLGDHRPGDRGALLPAQPHRAGPGRATRSSTPCSPNTPSSATSTATPSPSRTRSPSGRRSSATSSTAPRS